MIKLAHAVYDEAGRSSGGKPGDSTGKEVAIWDWYKSGTGWTSVIRAKDKAVASRIAQVAKDIANNNHIGYNQYNRLSLFKQAQAVNFDISKIKVNCDTDCSAMVAVCINASGIKISSSISTATQLNAIKATKQFDILTDKKYLTSAKYLQEGDILWRQGHTAVVVDIPTVKDLQIKLNEFGYGLTEDGIRGKKTNTAIDDLHMRVKAIDDMIAKL